MVGGSFWYFVLQISSVQPAELATSAVHVPFCIKTSAKSPTSYCVHWGSPATWFRCPGCACGANVRHVALRGCGAVSAQETVFTGRTSSCAASDLSSLPSSPSFPHWFQFLSLTCVSICWANNCICSFVNLPLNFSDFFIYPFWNNFECFKHFSTWFWSQVLSKIL